MSFVSLALAVVLISPAPVGPAVPPPSPPSPPDPVVQAFVDSHVLPVVDAVEGSALWDRQVRAQYAYWASVPWQRYFAQWGAKDVRITVELSRDDQGILRAGWWGVVPSELAYLALEPIAVKSDAQPMVARSSTCKESSALYENTICIYNRPGTNASSTQWRNDDDVHSSTFRMRTGYATFASGSCTGTTNLKTGTYETVDYLETYVLYFTSTMNTRFAAAGYNSALTVRKFLDCTGFI